MARGGTKLTEENLGAIIDAEFSSAMGQDGGEISSERAKNYKYYLSEKRGDEIPGQSQVVTSDVADVVDGFMPSLLRIFTTAENLVTIDPVTEEDEEMARQESDTINYVFFKLNNSFMLSYNWFMDAGIQRNGIVKAWWDKSEKVTQETYKGLTEAQLFDLMEDEELEPIERDERQETIEGNEVTLHDVKFTRTSTRGRIRIENVPPEEYRISNDSRSLDPSEARFVGQESEKKRHELIAMGFDASIVDSLPAHGTMPKSEEAIARRNKADETTGGPHDPSQDDILLREGYMRIDADGDGKAELIQVFTAGGGQVLSTEVVDRQPFHVICPHPLPHKHFGRAQADKAIDIQDMKTVLARQTLDNTYHSNMPRTAVNERALGDNTMDDLLTVRPGMNVRVLGSPAENIMQLPVQFTAPNSLAVMQWIDKIKEERTGIGFNSEGLRPEDMKHIQQSVFMQATDPSRMKQEAVARIYMETGFKSLFLHIHELLMKHQDIPMKIKLRNKWIETSPSEWRTRENITVNIGLGIGTREQNLLHIGAIRDLQAEIVQNGGMNLLIKPKNIYNTAKELVRNANFKQPEDFFTDPGDAMAPPPSDEQMKLQKQAMALQAEKLKLDAERQEINAARIQLDFAKEQSKNNIELEKLRQSQEKINNELKLGLDKISNELTKMELESGQNVPGSKV